MNCVVNNHSSGDGANVSLSSSPKISDGRVVIVGGGNIGRFLALEIALGGVAVSVIEPNPAVIEASWSVINTRLNRAAVLESEKSEVLGRIRFIPGQVGKDSAVDEVVASASMVVEALPERQDLKKQVLQHLDAIVAPDVAITTVSSSFPISELLEGVRHRERFINSHPLQYGMAPVEVMPSSDTAAVVSEKVSALFSEIGMAPIMVLKENVGFIFNIVWRQIKRQVLDLVERGVTTPNDFDRLWMMTFKTAIGPFGLMDMVGLDVVLDIEKRYFALTGKEDDRPPVFLEKMVGANQLGMKTNSGFYTYPHPIYQKPGFLERGGERVAGEVVVPIKESLAGSWRLVSFTSEKEGGATVTHPMGETPVGKLTYGYDGAMSVYLGSTGDRTHFTSGDPLGGSTKEMSRAFSEVFFYIGGWRYRNGLMLHDVEICSFPNWSGETQIRYATLIDGMLTLTTPPMTVGGSLGVQKLVWKREGL